MDGIDFLMTISGLAHIPKISQNICKMHTSQLEHDLLGEAEIDNKHLYGI